MDIAEFLRIIQNIVACLVIIHEVEIYWTLKLITTCKYNTFTNLCTLQITVAHIETCQSAVSSPGVAW
jgi:hypothetical protein